MMSFDKVHLKAIMFTRCNISPLPKFEVNRKKCKWLNLAQKPEYKGYIKVDYMYN